MRPNDYDAHAETCPSDETLAAWLDDRVTLADRQSIEGHVADCDDCAELVAALAAVLDDAGVGTQPVLAEVPAVSRMPIAALTDVANGGARTGFSRGRDRWTVTRTMQALAATLVLAVGGAMFWQMGTDVHPAEDLRALAAVQGEMRHTQGRLYGFPWAEAPRTYRSATAGAATSTARSSTTAEIERRYKAQDTPEARHALGVALLVGGDIDAAIAALESAVAARPNDAMLSNDAAVAHLQRAWASGDATSLRRARQLAESIVAQHPRSAEGWFNLMMAGRRAGDKALEARAASRLAELEPAASGWRTELPEP